MSEVKKIATREAFGETLVELGKKHPELVVLDADLAAATKTAVFKKSFPDRHFDCGIAEANMMGVAAGLVYDGMIKLTASNILSLMAAFIAAGIFYFGPLFVAKKKKWY